jgi:hypothetical protein
MPFLMAGEMVKNDGMGKVAAHCQDSFYTLKATLFFSWLDHKIKLHLLVEFTDFIWDILS